ncbi:MAG TPA: DNA methyltransferase [Bryobacterales bacterium]|nr:DNA methyltransferase [Bryobacterales bacterium]
MLKQNTLYFGDNLTILREHVADESVDLIYLDPPFNSNASYNVLFAEKTGEQSAAQITAFEDTWQWGLESEQAYHEAVTAGGPLASVLSALRQFLGQNDMMAYLVMIAVRLKELHRVLKGEGSMYLHCDPTASHYLKILLDATFAPGLFRNEICWKRSSAHSDTKQGMKRCGKIHDVLLFYTKSNRYTWNPIYTPYTKEYLESEYRHQTETGRYYKETDVTAAKPGGDTEYEWPVKRSLTSEARWEADLGNERESPLAGWEYKGVYPYHGRFWAYSKENLIQFAKTGHLIHRNTGMPRLVQFADEMPGIPLQDLWDDIPPESGQRDLGYPTQKPEALLERIIQAGSNEGDVVLDPFCGCGTAIAAAERLNRRWMGIDVTHLAITLIRHRLTNAFQQELKPYEVVGDPKDVPSAKALALENRFQFEYWVLGLVDARPANDRKRGADRGIDGYIYFFDDNSGQPKKLVVQVKSGKLQSSQVRDLAGTMNREEAKIGVFLTLEQPTREMVKEAATAGFYQPEYFPGTKYPRLQLITIRELFEGKQVLYPRMAPPDTFRRAKRKSKAPSNRSLMLF